MGENVTEPTNVDTSNQITVTNHAGEKVKFPLDSVKKIDPDEIAGRKLGKNLEKITVDDTIETMDGLPVDTRKDELPHAE